MKTICISVGSAPCLVRVSRDMAGGVNELTSKEKKDGWILLFNGKDLPVGVSTTATACPTTGLWKMAPMKVFCHPDVKAGRGAGGDLIHFPEIPEF